jgi:teichuronic acid biosynthesis glycosyltransferase TuaC
MGSRMSDGTPGRPRILIVSRNYPNAATPTLGLWVRSQTWAIRATCEVMVVSPVPYWPKLPGPSRFLRFREVPGERTEQTPSGPIQVLHPRYLTGPGYSSFAADAHAIGCAFARIRAAIRQFNPHLIHAHFAYPDGVVAARLGRALDLPVVITEHNFWRPQMTARPTVASQAVRAIHEATRLVCVSSAVRRTMESVAHRELNATIIPIGVDSTVFFPRASIPASTKETRLLFVGWLRPVKGMETLLRAVALLRTRRPELTLDVIGGDLLGDHVSAAAALAAAARRHGVEGLVRFIGPQAPESVAAAMRAAHLLVVTSERESCSAVLLEALASGIPVVSTRCGGPEDFVTRERGELAPVGDAEAISSACDAVLTRSSQFDPRELHLSVVQQFSWDRLASRYVALYRDAMAERCRKH